MSGIEISTRQLEEIEIKAWTDLYAAAHSLKENPGGISILKEDSYAASTISGCDVLALNRIVGWGEGSQGSVENLKRLLDLYRRAGVPRVFLQLHPSLVDSPAGRAAQECGFVHYNNWVKLYREVEPLTGVRSDLKVEGIGPERAEAFAAIVTECFDWDQRLRPWIGSVVGRPNWYAYLAYEGDRAAATGAFYRSGEYAWVDMAATLPDFRGRGAQTLLMQRRIEDAIKLGCKHLVVETAQETPERSAPSYRNMLRYGFQVAYVRPNYLYKF